MATIAAVVAEQPTTATAVATMMAALTMMTATAVCGTAAIVNHNPVTTSAVAAVATMTGDDFAVGAHQGDADDGEKHRQTKKYDSIHFCIPPFDSLLE